jgi:hypothetical protein
MLGENAAVENHIKKHQKKPTVAINSCSILLVFIARLQCGGKRCGDWSWYRRRHAWSRRGWTRCGHWMFRQKGRWASMEAGRHDGSLPWSLSKRLPIAIPTSTLSLARAAAHRPQSE